MESAETTDALFNWDFASANGNSGDSPLSGSIRGSVDSQPGDDDTPSSLVFSGGHVKVEDEVTLPIVAKGDFTLSVRLNPPDSTFDLDNENADGCLVQWVGENSEGKRHSLSLEVLSLGYLKDERFLCFFLDQFPYSVSLSRLRRGEWNSAVLRVEKGTVKLFINGEISETQRIPRVFPSNSTMSLSPASVIPGKGMVFGDNLRRDLPFHGKLARFAVWDRALSVEELKAESSAEAIILDQPLPPNWGTRWVGLFDEAIEVEEAYTKLDEDMALFLKAGLEGDPHFPLYHLTLPGMMTEPSNSTYKRSDYYHIYPHDCSHWAGNFLYKACGHMWQHFSSPDLVHWNLEPIPRWEHANNGNIIETESGAYVYPVFHGKSSHIYERWVSYDERQVHWKKDRNIEIPKAPHGIFPMNHFLFESDGKQYLLGAFASNGHRHPEVANRLELYRSRDNSWANWKHIGLFHAPEAVGTHHPRLFVVDGMMVVDSDRNIDNGGWYAIGRFEDEKFIREGVGDFHFDHRGWSWGQTITEADGRVLRWTMIRSPTSPGNLFQDVARRGWQAVYSLPRVMGVSDRKLTQMPAPELKKLRTEPLESKGEFTLPADSTSVLVEGDHNGALEIRTTIKVSEKGIGGIVLRSNEEDQIRIFLDASTGKFVCETSKSKTGGASHQNSWQYDANVEMPQLSPGDEFEMIVYYDRSVIEVFGAGQCTAARWFNDDPNDISVSVFTEGEDLQIQNANVWEMGSIWTSLEG